MADQQAKINTKMMQRQSVPVQYPSRASDLDYF